METNSEPIVVPSYEAFQWTDDMREISGMGGGYEATCRNMCSAGAAWLAANPTRDPKFYSYRNVTGILCEDNDAAKELSRVVVAAAFDDCTGAMHQYSIGHAMHAHKIGWPAYQEWMRDAKRKESAPAAIERAEGE